MDKPEGKGRDPRTSSGADGVMAIKKRPSVDPVREARIEAFGAAAEAPADRAGTPSSRTPTPVVPSRDRINRPRPATKGKTDLKPMLIRFEGWEHELLKEVAELEGRSMHNMAKNALIPALEAIRAARQR